MGKYDDIINLPHPDSKKHPRMPRENRAAQFAPFAALTGLAEQMEDEAKENTSRMSEDELFTEDGEVFRILDK
ncbi:MAG: hypothetical protein IIZ61_09415 [Lachnospiraceae bacterium]|nr:hypothetical protein [Lachnospiraceae bacterium]